nr:hypothetical protein [Marinobacter sp. BW6]
MHSMDKANVDRIVIELRPRESQWLAIMVLTRGDAQS